MDLCCVKGCNSVKKDKPIVYFEFPLSRTLRRKWLDVMKMGNKVPLGTLICSQHFDINDYDTVRGKVRLKKKVVPSILIDNDTSSNKSPKSGDLLTSEINKEILENPKDDDGSRSPNLDEIRRQLTRERFERENSLELLSDRVIDRETSKKTDGSKRLHKRDKREEVKDRTEIERLEKDMSKENSVTSDPKQPADFEEMITNYQIKIDKPDALRTDAMDIDSLRECERDGTIVVDGTGDIAPVFIEIPADKGSNPRSTNQDCLMVLESVQVEVDPSTLMLPESEPVQDTDSDVEINIPEDKVDPISLLTSSDESDVILQEPKIDTVEVSDETDEDDMPLVKLVNRKPLKKRPIRQKKTPTPINMDLNMKNPKTSGDYFFCVLCKFNTTNKNTFSIHLDDHMGDLYICSVCSYASYYKNEYLRHLNKHKKEKKYICNICGSLKGHEISLKYHLKGHEKSDIESVEKSFECDEDGYNDDKKGYKCDEKGYGCDETGYKCDKTGYKGVKKGYRCDKCGYRSDYKGEVVKHLKICNIGTKHVCNICSYTTKRKSDLKRHFSSRHSDVVNVV